MPVNLRAPEAKDIFPVPASPWVPPWPACARPTVATSPWSCSSPARRSPGSSPPTDSAPLRFRSAASTWPRARKCARILVNTGNANAGTGDDGLARARSTCTALAARLGCAPAQVLPFSTGVIMETLPNDRIEAGLPAAIADARADGWTVAAEAIMTTDTVPKAASTRLSIGGRSVAVTGISKGAGMIRPNMATMLGFVATDANLAPAAGAAAGPRGRRRVVQPDHDRRRHVDQRLLRADRYRARRLRADRRLDSADGRALREAVFDVSRRLAQAIVRDGEGATKFITIRIEGGASVEECRKVAPAIGHSPLVKTAFFASDPNLGRILAAVGYAGIADLDQTRIDLFLDDVHVVEGGGRRPSYREEDGRG